MSLRFVLLSWLSKEPATGYRLGRSLHSDLNHLWEAHSQQVYLELGKLETQGLVVAANQRSCQLKPSVSITSNHVR